MAARDSDRAKRRKAVQTPYMRRDSLYNPEYLDAERVLVRFAPLVESIVRKYRPWYGRYNTEQDAEDLRGDVQAEFLRLREKYDPSFGVDFPGYIKMNLERRIRYFIMRRQKHFGPEVLAFASDVTGNYMEAIPDDKAEEDISRVERVLSIPVEKFEDETYRDIIRSVLSDGEDVHSLAKRYNVTPRSMMAKIEAAGKYAREIMEQQAKQQMEYGDGKEET